MYRALAIVSETPELKEIADRFIEEIKLLETRFEFLKKQGEDIAEKRHKLEEQMGDAVAEILRAINKMPSDYDEQKDQLCIDLQKDCIIFHRHDEECTHQLGSFMENLFKPT